MNHNYLSDSFLNLFANLNDNCYILSDKINSVRKMKIMEKIGYYYIRYFLNPLNAEKTVNFTQSFNNAKTVFVIPPADYDKNKEKLALEEIENIFPDREISFFKPDNSILLCQNSNRCIYTSRFMQILKSPGIKNLSGLKTDILIDLEQNFNLLTIFIAKSLSAPVKISFDKPFSKPFFNLRFKPAQSESFENSLKEMCHFLQGFPSG